ncbi:translation initiation factor IF-2 subunit gamma, partial [Candidatus Woesearchaeota archaeon]|nr:translation initiation factor IF-2 subunit gamma [Candidatus Woesearchaeota archaeon]
LGYADGIFRKCPKCKGSKAYTTAKKCQEHDVETKALRKVSFVDAPGHESLMATMLSGATIMDAALLLVAANEKCPQPQTREHLMALEIAQMKNVVVVQNKIDLVSEEEAIKNYQDIKKLLKGTSFENAPIIPISAQHKVNIDVLIEAIEENMPTPKRDLKKDPIMFVARSFDINKPGITPEELQGGVLGGVLVEGKLKTKTEVEIKPGLRIEKEGRTFYEPIITKIESLVTGGQQVDEVQPGGNIGVQTLLDPTLVKADKLVGSVLGSKGKLPEVYETLKLEVHLLERVVGVEDELNVEPVKMEEMLMLNVNSGATVGTVTELAKDAAVFRLKRPVCANVGSRVVMSRRISNRFRLIGYGVIKK